MLSTDPKAGTEVEPGTKVNLVVAKASTKVEVPSLAGMNEDQARERLAELGLTLEAQDPGDQRRDPGDRDRPVSAGGHQGGARHHGHGDLRQGTAATGAADPAGSGLAGRRDSLSHRSRRTWRNGTRSAGAVRETDH